MAKLVVWTEAYRPFIMGGDVRAPISAEVEVGEPVDIGRGMTAHLLANPVTGDTHVAESTTGAFVGVTIKGVRADVASAPPGGIAKQLEAAARKKKATRLTPDAFWAEFRHTKPEEDDT